MSLEDISSSAGPWGGQGGIHWDDGIYSSVRQIVITHGAGIDSIRFEYDLKGTSVWSDHHGGSGGTITDKIKLNYPDEYLTCIRGCYSSLNEWGPVFVRSLTFESNKRIYGPYGLEQGTFFSLPATQAKIVGFHGACGWYLDQIGVHLQKQQQKGLYSNNSVVQYSQNYSFTSNGTSLDATGFSMVQGSLGKNYDLVIALRYKDDHNNGNSATRILSRQASNNSVDLSSAESKTMVTSVASPTIQKVAPEVAPPKIVRVASRDQKEIQGVMTYGPWGGAGGTIFDDGIYDGVRQINVSRNVGIVYIRICYDKDGLPFWGNRNGGTGGFKTDKIIFEYPSEILTHLSGYYGPTMVMGPNIIKSLTFYTNKRKYGPYGEEQGQLFTTKLREGMIVGFHGRKGLFVDAIGVHVVEKTILPAASLPLPSKPYNQVDEARRIQPKKEVHESIQPKKEAQNTLSKKEITQSVLPKKEPENSRWTSKFKRGGLIEEGAQRVVKDPSPSGPGPWGGEGGKPWDDGVFTGIKQIHLTRSDAICCIEIEYDRNGQSVWSVKHGGDGGKTTHQIKFEYPHEVLTRISGYYGPVSTAEWTNVIKSLTFYTTRKKYGPFGKELGTYFSSTTTEGKVVGLHGKSSMYLDAIGVHLQHWFGNQRSSKPSSLLKIFS